MATLQGHIRDAQSGARLQAKVMVVSASGRFVHPRDSLLKVGPGEPSFYSDGEFRVDVPRGATQIVVERGTEYEPLRQSVSMPQKGSAEVTLLLKRWTDLPSDGWYPGNTHLHYSESEGRPDDRLRMDPHVHDLSVTVVSILQRRELPYASNKFPIGFMTDYSTAHHVVDCGEESRHNVRRGGFGYGHVMFLRIRNLVDPVSRGDLVSDFDPDYPPLCFACDDARDQDGIVLWCHNGQGMEAPVAAALGKLDAFNLFDPYWCDPEYDVWYRLLNCGIRLPASTGTDWFICSNNRVYVQTDGDFSYSSWLDGLRAGRTFITNGPSIFLDVDGRAPGDELPAPSDGARTPVTVTWRSYHPLRRVEIVHNGRVVAAVKPDGPAERDGSYTVDVPLDVGGWVAARGYGDARDSFGHAVFAHTSPAYVGDGLAPRAAESASHFVRAIDEGLGWIADVGKFTSDAQRDEVAELFHRGRAAYTGILAGRPTGG
jgi:hypothetical protein